MAKAKGFNAKDKSGMIIADALLSALILSVTSMIVLERFSQLAFTRELNKSAYTLVNSDSEMRVELTNAVREIQRILAEEGCTDFSLSRTNYVHAGGGWSYTQNQEYNYATALSEYKREVEDETHQDVFAEGADSIGEAARAFQRCNTYGIQTGVSLENKDNFIYCFRPNEHTLVEAKVVLWDYNRDQAIQCQQLPGSAGRGAQVFYNFYAAKKMRRVRGNKNYSLRSMSGHLMVPKGVFYRNLSQSEVRELDEKLEQEIEQNNQNIEEGLGIVLEGN